MPFILISIWSLLLWVCFWASFKIPLWEEWSSLQTSPWFLATLTDLYVGLILMTLFTYSIKRSWLHSLIAGIVFFSLGNLATIIWLFLFRKDIYARFRH